MRAFFIWGVGIPGVQREKPSNDSPAPLLFIIETQWEWLFRPEADGHDSLEKPGPVIAYLWS